MRREGRPLGCVCVDGTCAFCRRAAGLPWPAPAAEKPQMPGLVTQARSFLGAMARAVRKGLPMVSDEEQARRLAICDDCEFFDAPRVRCLKCGCKANWKARLATEHCPINKW